MSEPNWTEINEEIQNKRTSWIQKLTKDQMTKVCEKLKIQKEDSETLDELRDKVREYVKKEDKEANKNTEVKEEEKPVTVKMTTYLGDIEVFRKEKKWSAFSSQLDAFMILNDITDEDKKAALLLTKLSSEVFAEVKAACEPQEILKVKYDDLNSKLKEIYEPEKNECLLRIAFKDRKQKNTESIQEYILALRNLAQKCKFSQTELDNNLKDQLIGGVRSELIRYELLKQSSLELKKFIEVAKAVELAHEKTPTLSFTNSASVAQSTSEFHSVGTSRKFPSRADQSTYYRQASNTAGRTQQQSPSINNANGYRQEEASGSQKTCHCCGKNNHLKFQCTLRFKFCSEYGKKGHIFKMCPQKNNSKINNSMLKQIVDEDVETSNDTYYKADDYDDSASDNDRYMTDCHTIKEYKLNSMGNDDVPPHFETIKINDIPLRMEVDSGAFISAISLENYQKYFAHIPIKESKITLRSYDGTIISSIGLIKVSIFYDRLIENQDLYVIHKGGHPLIGRAWLKILGMWPLKFEKVGEKQKIHYVHNSIERKLEDLQSKFKKVFEPGFGLFTKGPLKLELKPNTKPKFVQHYKVPFSLKSKVEAELKRLQDNSIIEPIEYSEWGTPIIPLLKKDGSIRIVGIFKITVNPFLIIDHFPLSRTDHIFSILAGGEKYTIIDFAEAFLQIPLELESQKVLVIVTHMGLFKCLRMLYGVATGPGSFQRKIITLLTGIPGVAVLIDDIVITAPNEKLHFDRLYEVIRRLHDAGLKVNKTKCKFFQDEINYLGHKIDKNGIHPLTEKIEKIRKIPRPVDISQLRSFLGSINYYSKFLPDLATKLQPLYECLEKRNGFKWTEHCEKTFQSIKEKLTSEQLLVHFDSTKEIILTCDASPYGISAVIAHKDDNNIDRPIQYASRTLNSSERNYSQLDREGLAIIFGVKTFYEYLFGNEFILQTDNAALSRIFDLNKSIPTIAAARLQRWAAFLSAYRYKIKHIKGKDNYADWLSRMPMAHKETNEKEFPILEEIPDVFLNSIKSYDFASLDWKQVQKNTREDKILCKVISYCKDGWPEKEPENKELKTFWRKREAISIESNCVLWGHRVVIPDKLRILVLKELHYSHFGICKMKALARGFVWWPSLDNDLEEITRSCLICLKTKKNPVKIPLTPWAWPTTPWHRVHADFLGPLNTKMILLVIDSHSKWPEAFIMTNMTESETIRVFKELFSRYGYPSHLITDNFQTFVGQQFSEFVKRLGIRHSTSPPHCPATNGAAENLVDTFKRKVKCIIHDGLKLYDAVEQFLLDYRTTPHCGTNQTPAKLFLGREIRTRFSLLRPRETDDIVYAAQSRQIKNHKGARHVNFKVGDKVVVTDYRGRKESWAEARIVRELVPGVTYLVEVDSNIIWKRHSNQMREYGDNTLAVHQEVKEKEALNTKEIETAQQSLRRSERLRLSKKVT